MIFIYFQYMANDFLHKIDLNALSAETGLSLEEIAKLVGISDPKNLSKWKQEKPDGSRPKYNALIKLLKNGATVKTLFGVDCSERKKVYPNIPPEFLESPEFHEGVKLAVEEVLKTKGYK